MPLEPESVVTGIRMTPERIEEYKVKPVTV